MRKDWRYCSEMRKTLCYNWIPWTPPRHLENHHLIVAACKIRFSNSPNLLLDTTKRKTAKTLFPISQSDCLKESLAIVRMTSVDQNKEIQVVKQQVGRWKSWQVGRLGSLDQCHHRKNLEFHRITFEKASSEICPANLTRNSKIWKYVDAHQLYSWDN